MIIIMVALLVVFGIYENNALTTSSYTIDLGLTSGYKIVQISDLHNKSFGDRNSKLVEKIVEARPDSICITGDVVDASHTDTQVSIDLVKQLVKVAPVYYVTGNHERALQSNIYTSMEEAFVANGVHVINNQMMDINGELQIIGLDDRSQSVDDFTLETVVSSGDKEKKTILLAHEPQLFDKYVSSGVQLLLSGHAHGGQVRIPFMEIGIVAPNQGFFPQYTSGVFRKNGTSMVVSRGLGNSILPLRIFNRPEVVEITIE